MQGTIPGGRRRGRQRKRWDDNIKEWTGLELRDTLRRAEHREGWSSLVKRTVTVAPRATRKGRGKDPQQIHPSYMISGSVTSSGSNPRRTGACMFQGKFSVLCNTNAPNCITSETRKS
ncbi:UDP-glucuronosyltransferase 2a1-like [Plakobranchus ocellatus]|uniref:UDP-glucuronosyltransferase 2a1-like n=1 Tax=Plakobranchus ocellatus TaxID=259542 RepID=A0AAV4BNL6_9GAST|nr:UDP-glucuronosyltransferase 2a1-like [Plakobranchus ocellatus]